MERDGERRVRDGESEEGRKGMERGEGERRE